MATPITRSSRRSEGLTTRSSTRNNVNFNGNAHVAIPPAHHNNQAQNKHQSNIGRKKRPRDDRDDEQLEHEHPLKSKKAKISVEITSHPQPAAISKTRALVIKANASSDVAPAAAAQRSPPPQHAAPKSAKQPAAQLPAQQDTQQTTVHHQKVVNGIKHELALLDPRPADLNKDEKRKLRSQEGTRFKSELSQYFPEYDEVIGNEPKEDRKIHLLFRLLRMARLLALDILNLDTPIIILDSAKTSKQPPSPRKTNGETDKYPLKEFPDSLFDDLHNAHRLDFTWMEKNYQEEGGEDPLSNAYFEGIHRKPERQEKQIRNGDRGRAQHEKDQVIRLLEGLQGHDWLKLMGVSGITEGKKKDFEPARDHFIKGCENILEKFRTWKEEEKRRKLEREIALAEAEAEEELEEEVEEQEEAEEDAQSNGDPPDYSDVDASAARQLHEEAIARSAPLARKQSEKRAKVEVIPPSVASSAEYEKEKEFKSFFPKPHLRQAALGKHRRSNRSTAAFGHPVPELPQEDFDLPEQLRDEETLKIHARRKRLSRRVSKS
ncbi:hypothetical protein LSUE1_G009657 [Lachnellula suecica]|uniref:Something about silencing protein 4 domain-containing protein n=1 Tax=Lachnellula suecica TaxID=602035 RepID=A0A8T9BSE2_9HELO|nr:hypothetical protein LSUE1_G009657 [Lachnellula suecica]